jgi:hypothetical protein
MQNYGIFDYSENFFPPHIYRMNLYTGYRNYNKKLCHIEMQLAGNILLFSYYKLPIGYITSGKFISITKIIGVDEV